MNDPLPDDLALIQTTWPADHNPQAMIHAALAQKLAACVHVHPAHTAHYFWGGQSHADAEQLLTFKTTYRRTAALSAHIQAHHPHEVPAIWHTRPDRTMTPHTYMAWVINGTKP